MTKIIEKIVETKSCQKCQISFDITDRDLEFYDKVSPVFTGEKMVIPIPTLCPECRQQRRMAWRNERYLYKRKCDATWKTIISVYSPDKLYKVYNQDFWWGGNWDAVEYWIDYNSNAWFFEQLEKIIKKVPRLALSNSNKLNSDFCNHTTSMKDCYFVFWSAASEQCLYSNRIEKSDHVVDSSFVNNSSFIYECFDVKESYNMYFSQKSYNCSDSFYLFDCHNCQNCFWSVNLINKQYYIFNKQYSKEKYFDEINKLRHSYTYSEFKDRIKLNAIIKYSTIENSEEVVWDSIYNSKAIAYSFWIYDSENIKYSQDLYNNSINSYDCYSWYWPIEKCYECHSFGVGWYKNLFVSDCYPAREVLYSDNCYSCSHLFGCAWLQNKQYCILNKQYTQQEYEELVPKIIEKMKQNWEWWEFLPSHISPFGYNESVVSEYFPLEKEDAIAAWLNWSDYETPFPKVERIIPTNKLPENIWDVPDDILNWAIECEITKKPFKIIPQELEFYRKHNISIPKRHPDQRHLDRVALRNPGKLFERGCDSCNKTMQTSYASEWPEKVYCEECYNKEIY